MYDYFIFDLIYLIIWYRGVVIAANILSIASTAFGFFAVYYDRAGITYLQEASTTQGYCEQLLAAGFFFDIVMIVCSLAMFVVSFLSLLCPGCFNEQTYESVLRQDQAKKLREERQRQRQQQWQGDEEGGPGDSHRGDVNDDNDYCEDSKDFSEKSADGKALYDAAYGGSSRKIYMPSHNGDFEDVPIAK